MQHSFTPDKEDEDKSVEATNYSFKIKKIKEGFKDAIKLERPVLVVFTMTNNTLNAFSFAY